MANAITTAPARLLETSKNFGRRLDINLINVRSTEEQILIKADLTHHCIALAVAS
jgi:hypothetical protein